MNTRTDVTLAVLCGGEATRLDGIDKASIRIGGRPSIDRVLDVLAPRAYEVLLVQKPGREAKTTPGVRVVYDPIPEQGPLAGLIAALEQAVTDTVFLTGCDMPFPVPELFDLLCENATDADVVVCRRDGHIEPVFAVYHTRMIDTVRRRFDQGKRRLISFFDDVQVVVLEEDTWHTVDLDGRSFFSVNTPEDLAEAWRYVEGGY